MFRYQAKPEGPKSSRLLPYVKEPKYQRELLQDERFSKKKIGHRTLTMLGVVCIMAAASIFDQGSPRRVLKALSDSDICKSGALRSRLFAATARYLCEVHQGEYVDEEYVADDIPWYLIDESNVAFVVTVPSCPEDTSTPTAEDEPGAAFYDAAAILQQSICNCTGDNPDSGSHYNSTRYAIIHPDAIHCQAPTEGGRRLASETYNRVAMLEELGYYVLILGEPVDLQSISDENTDLKNKYENETSVRDLMRLYSYTLVRHSMAVMVEFDTLFLEPLDTILDEFKGSSEKARYTKKEDGTVNPGAIFIKPDWLEYNAIVETFNTTTYDDTNGWGGSGVKAVGVDGLLSHYYNQRSNENKDLSLISSGNEVKSFKSNSACGKPWECNYDPAWDEATAAECRTLAKSWYTYRKTFEDKWIKTDIANTSQSDFETDTFLGYCTGNGKGGYQPAIEYTPYTVELTPQPTLLPTPLPTAQPTTSLPTALPTTSLPTALPTTSLPTALPTTSSPTAAATDPAELLKEQWLYEHNSRREAFYNLFPESYGVTNVPLLWSADVAQSAQNYANMLIGQEGCTIQHGLNGDRYGGENLAMNWGTFGLERTPAEILNAWYDDEIDLNALELVGQKYHASQVIFRSSKYLGCGHAQKTHNGGTCYIQVCRYVMSGNCFLENYLDTYPWLDDSYFPPGCSTDYPNKDWLCSTLSGSAGEACSSGNDPQKPRCPAEGCFEGAPTPPPAPTNPPSKLPTLAPVTPAPSSPQIGGLSAELQQQWLYEHNIRRETFYNLFPESYGVTNVPLKWSADVAQSAQNYANMLIALDGCVIQHELNGDKYGGENLAMNWATNSPERTPAEVLNAWYDDEIDLNALELVG
eukprot:CAMPEP_0178925124 /NCGR_PEP_ID=MMETSP0786-20121207/17726_1 /TAXON_ID=186022 /ORGANISM="Thalassionema frauenfeldii, Strain CCMP 1798" /LENGTH=866 /DNA_ID=CAMNT_0020599947 /DNA_START=26 /DNA_END=2622 /DNA_ORIENTATION=+